MMGLRQEAQSALFYDFSIEDHVPTDHVLRAIDGVIDLSSVRTHLAEFYSSTGRPLVDPELMITARQGLAQQCPERGGCCWWDTPWTSSLRTASVRRGPSKPCLSVVLQDGFI